MSQLLYRFPVDCDIHKCPSSPTESLVPAMNQGQIAADRWINKAACNQRACPYLVRDIGPGNESNSNIGGDKAFKQFTGIKLHRYVRFQPSLLKNLVDCVP